MKAASCKHPLFLVPNRFYRGYPGGREIDLFRGSGHGEDDQRPEAWVGSTTRVAYHPEKCPNGGLAELLLDSGEKVLLRDYILSNPEEILGERHVKMHGKDLCILVKLLDAQRQLGLQTHPDRDFAKKKFNSEYGKVESWYILGLREDQEEKPYVLLGFKEGVTRDKFQDLFLQGKLHEMERCCHKIEVSEGEMYFVDAGVPHAIGPGCFVIEVQEPSDITVGATMRSFDDEEERQNYIERTMGCYHYDGRSYEENLETYRVKPEILYSSPQGKEILLLGKAQTPFFSVTRVESMGDFKARDPETFCIGIVTEGKGKLVYDGGEIAVKKGDELFFPAGVRNLHWVAEQGPLSAVLSFPPDASKIY